MAPEDTRIIAMDRERFLFLKRSTMALAGLATLISLGESALTYWRGSSYWWVFLTMGALLVAIVFLIYKMQIEQEAQAAAVAEVQVKAAEAASNSAHNTDLLNEIRTQQDLLFSRAGIDPETLRRKPRPAPPPAAS